MLNSVPLITGKFPRLCRESPVLEPAYLCLSHHGPFLAYNWLGHLLDMVVVVVVGAGPLVFQQSLLPLKFVFYVYTFMIQGFLSEVNSYIKPV